MKCMDQNETDNVSMKCIKVPGTLARIYANEHMCILITHVALEGRVTLAKMAENSLKF